MNTTCQLQSSNRYIPNQRTAFHLTSALLLAFHFLLSTAAVGATAGVFYVGPNGNDQWSGERATPNSTKKDGPFATVERALAVARSRKQSRGAPATIHVGSGVYFLKEPLVLRPEDSGLTLASLPKEHPVLSGGRPISGWKEVERDGKRFWAADLPEVRTGNWVFHELWVKWHASGPRQASEQRLFESGEDYRPAV